VDEPFPELPYALEYQQSDTATPRKPRFLTLFFGIGVLAGLFLLSGSAACLKQMRWVEAGSFVGVAYLYHCVSLYVFGSSCKMRRKQKLVERSNVELRAFLFGVGCVAGDLFFAVPWCVIAAVAWIFVVPVVASYFIFCQPVPADESARS
jgi:hypothetical protein